MSESEELLRRKISILEEKLKLKELEVNRYRTELTRANQSLEKVISDLASELKFAHLIQKILCPTDLPNISGVDISSKFVPGYEYGGDYFDVFEHDDRLKFGVLVAGSTGYAMSALFLSVLIKMSAQIEAKKGLPPDKVIAAMAKEMGPQVQGKDKSHLFYAVIDRRTFELNYSLVGDLPVFLQPYGQEYLTRLAPSTEAIGAEYSSTPLAQVVQLNSKDRLIVCSNGIVRSANNKGQEFGFENLQQTIIKGPKTGVHELRNEILFRLEEFTGLTEMPRDLTVVIMEIKDRVIKLAK